MKKLLKYLKSLIQNNLMPKISRSSESFESKEIENESLPKLIESKEFTEPLLTVSQAAKKIDVTRQAIFFAIKMKRLNASQENGTWLLSERDLKEYIENRYSRAKSRKNGELIYDKSKGFFSISEAAKFLGKNTNHIYYLVRMGKLKTHRQGSLIVIQDTDLYNYAEKHNQKSKKNMQVA